MAALAAATWCVCALPGTAEPLAIKNIKGSVSWSSQNRGLGSFVVQASVPTAVTNLHQLALSQPSFFTREGWPGLNAWEDWVIADTNAKRTYQYKGKARGKSFTYSITLTLKKGVLTVSVTGSSRGYVDGMLALADTTSSGVATCVFALDLKDANGTSAVAGTATVQMNYVNEAGKKSTASPVKD